MIKKYAIFYQYSLLLLLLLLPLNPHSTTTEQ